MPIISNTSSPTLLFTPRLVEGPPRAPRVVFLDPVAEPPENGEDRVAWTLDHHGEAVFAVSRYAISEGNRRLGKSHSPSELPEYGAPDVIRSIGRTLHALFAATFPPAWDTGLVRSYALPPCSPTIRFGMRAQQWLADLGPSASNRLLWPRSSS